MAREKPYYSVRTGKNPHGGGFGLSSALKLFLSAYYDLQEAGYFQEYFGYDCIDAGVVSGVLGTHIDAAMLLELRKENLWPISGCAERYSEDDLFDVIEYLYDHVSKGVGGLHHTYLDCGWHYDKFDKKVGQVEFRNKINKLLSAYREGYELSEGGEILTLPEKGFDTIHGAKLPNHDPDNIEAKVEAAMHKFRRHRSSLEDRRDAIRELADVLEFLRPKIKDVLSSDDERDLFNIANNFGIRHHNQKQKTNYDKSIWYSWLFYYYLSTIHAALRLLERGNKTAK